MATDLSTDYQGTIVASWAATALFTYDILITMDDEIAFVWNSEWSLPKVMYLLTRYIGYSSSVFNSIISTSVNTSVVCRYVIPVAYSIVLLGQAMSDGLLTLRVMALLSDRPLLRRMSGILYLVLFVIESAIAIGFFVLFYKGSAQDGPDYGCFSLSSGPVIAAGAGIGAMILSFNTFLFTLTLITLAPKWRFRDMASPLFVVLLRDGTFYFAVICTTLLLWVVMLAFTNRPGFAGLPMAWLTSVIAMVTSRLFLNLRGVVRRPATATTLRTIDMSMPVFNIGPGASNFGTFADETMQSDPALELDAVGVAI